MKTRLYSTFDYPSIRPWWQGHWGEAPHPSAIPQSGLIVEGEGGNLAAGWLYLDTTTPTALLAFVVANPANPARVTHHALKTLVGGLIELALSQGRGMIIAACPAGSLGRLLAGCGFISRDKNIEHLTLDLSTWQQE